jgi:RNA polymerase sigma-54 factor
MGLKPLTMEDVADEVGVHVSTVSRAAAGKVADTPAGIYALRYFFTGAVAGDRGDVAVEKVKALLRGIIEDEDPTAPYSDEVLAEKLAERGVYIARRTVAKYRKELNIPPKHERRKVL